MASNTSNLGLLKKDPLTDGKDTFNIRTMLNDNWDKIDDFAGETIPISRGGTGATTAAQALANLGGAPAYTYGTEDLTAGSSPLETGKLYFVYE